MMGSLPATDVVDEAAGWLWTGVISFLLLRGSFDTEGPTQ
jgi:hypothetical protein